MAKKPKKWMQKAFSKNKGLLTKKAKAAGMSISAFCNPKRRGYARLDTKAKRECVAARNAAAISRKRKRKKR